MRLFFARIKAFFAGFRAERALKAVIEAPAQAVVAVAAAPAEAAKAAIIATAPVVKAFKQDHYVGGRYDQQSVMSFRACEAKYGAEVKARVDASWKGGETSVNIPPGWGR